MGTSMRLLFAIGLKGQTVHIVPWNYTNKLDEINRMVKEYGGPDAKIKTFSGYLNECWEEAMTHSDTQLKTAPRPAKAK